jgi:hypothetical protein
MSCTILLQPEHLQTLLRRDSLCKLHPGISLERQKPLAPSWLEDAPQRTATNHRALHRRVDAVAAAAFGREARSVSAKLDVPDRNRNLEAINSARDRYAQLTVWQIQQCLR